MRVPFQQASRYNSTESKTREATMATEQELDESSMFGEDPLATAKRILTDGAPFAAAQIVAMSTDDTIAPTVKLRAAQYIIDRGLGPVGGSGDADDLLGDFLQELQNVANGMPSSGKKKS
jgi:hypothetical protein